MFWIASSTTSRAPAMIALTATMDRGYEYWKKTFFLPDGTPRYYNHKTLPIDIQCSSQAIDTLVFFSDRDPESLPLAMKVAQWTIENMQDRTGYFYYRRYSRWLVNKTPTLHWGQATMLCALAGLYQSAVERGFCGEENPDYCGKPAGSLGLPRVEGSSLTARRRIRSHCIVPERQGCAKRLRIHRRSSHLSAPDGQEGQWPLGIRSRIHLRAVLGVSVLLVDLPAARISCHSGLAILRTTFFW